MIANKHANMIANKHSNMIACKHANMQAYYMFSLMIARFWKKISNFAAEKKYLIQIII